MQINTLFVPGGSNDPLVVTPTDGTLVQSIWLPNPTNLVKISVLEGSGYTEVYQLTELSSETVPLGPGLASSSVKIQSTGGTGSPFWIITSDQLFSPFKEPPVLSIPAIIDLSGLNIFNALAYGFSNVSSPSANVSALNAAAVDAQAVNGGTLLLVNQGSDVTVNGTITLNPGAFNNLNITQTSSAMKILQEGAVDTFYLNNGGGSATFGGQSWTGINVKYLTPSAGAAFHIAASPSTVLTRCFAEDAPVGFFLDNTLLTEAILCTANYNTFTTGVGFLISGPASHTSATQQSRIERFKVLMFGGIGVAGSYGVQCAQANHSTIVDGVIGGAYTGIGLTPSSVTQNNVQMSVIDNCEIGANHFGILGQPLATAGSGSRLQDVRIFGGQTQGDGNADVNSVGNFWDTHGGSSIFVDGVQSFGQIIESWGLYGIQISSGQNYNYFGGRSNGNGTAGVAITGVGATNYAKFTGVDLNPSYQGGASQTHAVVYSASAGFATFDRCPMVGYGTPVSVTGTPTQLRFIGCMGYNDQNTAVVPLNSLPTSGTTAAAQGYFGPSMVTIGSTPTSYHKNLTVFTCSEGDIVYLDPYDTFLVIGGTNGIWQGIMT